MTDADRAVPGPVFIVGCGRSGTTLLAVMLNQAPELYIFREAGFLPDLVDRAEAYGDLSRPEHRARFIADLKSHRRFNRDLGTDENYTWSVFDLTDAEAEAALAAAAPTDYPGACEAICLASVRKRGKVQWGDKTPRQIRHVPFLARAFPRSRIVHVYRDGRDVAISMGRAGWFDLRRPGRAWREAAEFWAGNVRAGRAAGRDLPDYRYREVAYETLVTDPEPTLGGLCEWLGVTFTPAMLHHEADPESRQSVVPEMFKLLAKPVTASRVEAWRQEIDPVRVAEFESVAGPVLAELGYGVANPAFGLPG
ncbi:MAG: sulfotransferase [Phycisphaerae bacterium]